MIKLSYIWICLALFIFFSHSAYAQDGIDTMLIKGYGIKKMKVWVKLPILPKRTLNDSCLAEIYEFDTLARITYQNNDMSCYGWGGSTENFNTYDTLNRIIFCKQLTDGQTTFIRYFYNLKNDLIKTVQSNPQFNDSMVIHNDYFYDKFGRIKTKNIIELIGLDTTKYTIKYDYDTANNISVIWTYTGDMRLIQKQSLSTTPISKKLLEFQTETKLPNEKFSKGWNYYNFNAQLSHTKYSNNTWIEYVYSDDGLLEQSLSYNMEGKLNAWKSYFYEYYETDK
jgi:hypothetical protein